jgi:hypothetical protein
MRRVGAVALLAAMAALAASATSASAQSEWTPVTDPLGSGTPNGSITLPAGNCGFPVQIAVVANREREKVTPIGPPSPAGTTLTQIRGKLVLSFTNTNRAKTIVRDESGPTDTYAYPTGTGIETATGENWWGFGPRSQANTGEPGLVFTSGPVVLSFGGGAVTAFWAERQINGCSLMG